jgi:Protein of unknown function, DUF488
VVIARRLFTVGHSTRSQDELLAVLAIAGVRAVADVRAFPSSRRHPHFNRGALEQWLPEAGIDYVHLAGLGGRREPVPGSINGGWRERAFQGYADHMASDEFVSGLARLEELAVSKPTAIMCAEVVWWRCHRRLIADAMTVRGWRVEHLGVGSDQAIHELPSFAVVEGGRLRYPPSQGELFGNGQECVQRGSATSGTPCRARHVASRRGHVTSRRVGRNPRILHAGRAEPTFAGSPGPRRREEPGNSAYRAGGTDDCRFFLVGARRTVRPLGAARALSTFTLWCRKSQRGLPNWARRVRFPPAFRPSDGSPAR